MTPREIVEFMQYLKVDCGYLVVRPCADDPSRWKAIAPFLYTYAILTGPMGDRATVSDRWCYHSPEAAVLAFEHWDGTGEPFGWHRHPFSGRRRLIDQETGEQVEVIHD